MSSRAQKEFGTFVKRTQGIKLHTLSALQRSHRSFLVDGGFTEWSAFGPCSTSCGPGIQVKSRSCTNPPPINNGSDCVGPREESRACNNGPCPGKASRKASFYEKNKKKKISHYCLRSSN